MSSSVKKPSDFDPTPEVPNAPEDTITNLQADIVDNSPIETNINPRPNIIISGEDECYDELATLLKKQDTKKTILNSLSRLGTDLPKRQTTFDCNKKGFEEDPTNLDNLIYLKPKDLQDFVNEVNGISYQKIGSKKVVIGIFTGGTIASQNIKGKGKTAILDSKEVLRHMRPSINEKFIIKGFNAFCLDSSQTNYDIIHDLAIMRAYFEKNIDIKNKIGYLYFHGTDTITEAGTFFSTMIGRHNLDPYIFTGGQESIETSMGDSNINMEDSIFSLENMHRQELSAPALVFGRKVFSLLNTEKISEIDYDAFHSRYQDIFANIAQRKSQGDLEFSWGRKKQEEPNEYRIFQGISHIYDMRAKISENFSNIIDNILQPNIEAVLIEPYKTVTLDKQQANAVFLAAEEREIPVFLLSGKIDNSSIKDDGYDSLQHMVEYCGFELIPNCPVALARSQIQKTIHMNLPFDELIAEVLKSTKDHIDHG
jgi:L-asparaginase/Glu-tRNA(Gln) amidotransferase subunit D